MRIFAHLWCPEIIINKIINNTMKKLLLTLFALLPLSIMAQTVVNGGYTFTITRSGTTGTVAVSALNGESTSGISATITGKRNGTAEGFKDFTANYGANAACGVTMNTNLTQGTAQGCGSAEYILTISGLPEGTKVVGTAIATNAINGEGQKQATTNERTRQITITATNGTTTTTWVNAVESDLIKQTIAARASLYNLTDVLATNTYTDIEYLTGNGDLVISVFLPATNSSAGETSKGVYAALRTITLKTERPGQSLTPEQEAIKEKLSQSVVPGEQVGSDIKFYITADQKTVMTAAIASGATEEQIAAGKAVADALVEGSALRADKVYAIMSGATDVDHEYLKVQAAGGNIPYMMTHNTTPIADDAIATSTDYHWMISPAAEGNYVLYNIATHGVANSVKPATAQADHSWNVLIKNEGAAKGLVAISNISDLADTKMWRIRDTESAAEGYFMNVHDKGDAARGLRNSPGLAANPWAHWRIVYVADASAAQQSDLEYAESVMAGEKDVNLSIGTTGFATLYYGDRALALPTDAEVWYFMTSGDQIAGSKLEADDFIAAGEGMLIKGSASTAVTFPATTVSVDLHDGNMLKGTDVEQTVTASTGAKLYVLSYGSDNKVGFYLGGTDGSSFTNGAHKAYLEVGGTAEVRGFALDAILGGGSTTGIDAVLTASSTDKCFDLSGREVNMARKGLYIINGKKVVK